MEEDGAEQIPLKPRDDYQIVDRIGRGAFGDVFLCQHRVRGDRLCVKEVDLQLLSPIERRCCMEEVAVLRRLQRHPHIISLLDAFRDQDSPNLLLLVLEFADAGDLSQFLLAAHGINGESRLYYRQQVLPLFAQIIKGVTFLHARNVLHRDLKPQNVFLFHSTEHNERFRAVVGDFGSSKMLSSSAALAQTVVGSPLYMSPELLENEPYGPPTDVWSLGCILHELLAGQPPFRAPSYPAVVRKITRGEYIPLTVEQTGDDKVRELVGWMLQRDPSKRPTAKDLLESPALAPYLPRDGDINGLVNAALVKSSVLCGDEAPSTLQLTTVLSDDHQTNEESLAVSGTEVNDENYGITMPPPAPAPLPMSQQPTPLPSSQSSGVTDSSSYALNAGGVETVSMPTEEQRHAGATPLPNDKIVAATAHHVLRQQQQMTRNRQHHTSSSRTPETLSLPPPPANTRAPALRPSFLPKSAQRSSSAHAATTNAPRIAAAVPKHKPIPGSTTGNISSSSNCVRTPTTVSELLVVGVCVTSKRPSAPPKTTKSLHGK